jgi:hypothetical protein
MSEPIRAWRYADAPEAYRATTDADFGEDDAVILIPAAAREDLPVGLRFLGFPSKYPGHAMYGPHPRHGAPTSYMTFELPGGDLLAFVWEDDPS